MRGVSQITGVSIVCPAICSGADQRKHQISASLAFVRGNQRRSVDSPHKGPVRWKMFPLDDVFMISGRTYYESTKSDGIDKLTVISVDQRTLQPCYSPI